MGRFKRNSDLKRVRRTRRSGFAPLLQIKKDCQHLAQWHCVLRPQKTGLTSPLNWSIFTMQPLTLLLVLPCWAATIRSYVYPISPYATIASSSVSFSPRSTSHNTTGIKPTPQNRAESKKIALGEKRACIRTSNILPYFGLNPLEASF